MAKIFDDNNVYENKLYVWIHQIERSTLEAVPEAELFQPVLDWLVTDYYKKDCLPYLIQRVNSGQLVVHQIGQSQLFKLSHPSMSRFIKDAAEKGTSLSAAWAISTPESLLLMAIDSLNGSIEQVRDYDIAIKYNELSEPYDKLSDQASNILAKILKRLLEAGKIYLSDEDANAYNTNMFNVIETT